MHACQMQVTKNNTRDMVWHELCIVYLSTYKSIWALSMDYHTSSLSWYGVKNADAKPDWFRTGLLEFGISAFLTIYNFLLCQNYLSLARCLQFLFWPKSTVLKFKHQQQFTHRPHLDSSNPTKQQPIIITKSQNPKIPNGTHKL